MMDFETRIHNVTEYDIHGSRITVWYDIKEGQMIDFGQALMALKNGYVVQRAGWNGKGQSLKLQEAGPDSYMTLPYIYITTVQGDRVPWLASQTDMLAEDWEIVNVVALHRKT